MSLLYANACKSSANNSSLSFSKMRLEELFDKSIYLPQSLINRCFNSSSTRYWCLINNSPTDDEIIIYVIDSGTANAINIGSEENPYYVMRVNLLQEQYKYNPSSLSNTWLMYKNNSKKYVNFDPNYYSCVNNTSPNVSTYNTFKRQDMPFILLAYFIILLMVLTPCCILWKRFRKR